MENPWLWVGLVVAVGLGAVGLWLLVGPSSGAKDKPTRPRREQFRRGGPEEPPPLKRAAFVVHGGKVGEGLADVQAQLSAICRGLGWDEPLVLATTAEDVGFGQTARALAEDVDVVCAYGGDGTVRAVAQALVRSGTPLGLLPMGTGNLLARNLDLHTDDLETAVKVALTGRNRHIDTGWVRLGGSAERHTFTVIAGLGFDAAIMDDTSENLKARVGWPAYVGGAVKNLLGERFRATMVIDDGSPIQSTARTILFGNCGKLQAGLLLMPEAEPDDGVLDVVTISPKGLAGWAHVAAKVIAKSGSTNARIDRYRGTSATVDIDENQPVEVDGDVIGDTDSLEVGMEPRSLIVRIP